jgi:UDP-N-acetylglucosamine--N-acetylmuramyl-(pentapeptide) pyrophosphoryl-undecaprenol N-acetylglucosamine transferase
MTAQKLADVLAGLDRPRLLELASHAHALARPGAAARVADLCVALADEQ